MIPPTRYQPQLGTPLRLLREYDFENTAYQHRYAENDAQCDIAAEG